MERRVPRRRPDVSRMTMVSKNKTTSPSSNNNNKDGDTKSAPAAISSSTRTLLTTITILISICIGGALTGIFPGYYSDTTLFQTPLLLRDLFATAVSIVLAYTYVQTITQWHVDDRLTSRDARKLIHTGAAPLFILVWPAFTDGGRFLASTVAVTNGVRLWLSAQQRDSLAKAVSRSGDTAEATQGPLVYCVMLTLAILLFWRTSPAGIVAMGALAAGDGMADVVGRRWGASNPWWFSAEKKSVAGTMAFIVAGSLTSWGLLQWMRVTGCLVATTSTPLVGGSEFGTVVLITTVAAALELLPFGDDNYTVPISAALLSLLLLQ